MTLNINREIKTLWKIKLKFLRTTKTHDLKR